MKTAIILVAILMASPSFAQQQTAAERIASELGRQFIQNQNNQDVIASLQDQLAKAQARIKELEARTEPKKE